MVKLFKTPKNPPKKTWLDVKKHIENHSDDGKGFQVWLIGTLDASSYYYISNDEEEIYFIYWYGTDKIEAQRFLESWKERTRIHYTISEGWSLLWYGSKTVELYYYDQLVEAYTIGMNNRTGATKEEFTNYAQNFEITEDHPRMIEENRY